MVLCKRHLPPADEIVSGERKPTGSNSAVYHQITQNRSVGLLSQLALLTQFASEVFTSVLQDVQTTQVRIDNLKTRSANLQQRMSTNSKTFYSNPANLMQPRVDISLGQEITDQVLGRQTLPKPLAIAYSKCQAPPPLDGPALKLYTNPDFFVESFLKDQHSRIVNQRKEHQRTASARKSNKDVVKRGLAKVTYDETGKMIVSVENRPTPPPKISVPTPSKPAPPRMVDPIVTAPPEFVSPPQPAAVPPRTHQPPLPPQNDVDAPPSSLPPNLPRDVPPELPPSLPPSEPPVELPSNPPRSLPPSLPPSMPPRSDIPPPVSQPPSLPSASPPPLQVPPGLPPSQPPASLPPTSPPASVPPSMPPPMQPTPQPASPPAPGAAGPAMKRGGGPPPPPPGAMKQGGGPPPPPGQKPAMNIPDVAKAPKPAAKPQMSIPDSSADRDNLLAQIREGRNKPLNKVEVPDPAAKPKPANQNTQQSQLERALEAMRRDIGDSQSEDEESWSQDWGDND